MTAPWTHPLTAGCAAQAARVAACVPVLRTPRLTLRAPVLADFAAWAEIVCSDRGTHIGGPFSQDEAWDDFCRAVAVWMLRGHGLWTVTVGEGEVAGFALVGFEPGDAEPELGFLFRAAFEGKGLALEAAAAARDHAFDVLGLPALASYVAPENPRSARLAARLGAECLPDLLDGSQVWRHHPDRRTA